MQRDSGAQCKVIVFLSTQDSVEFHYTLLSDCLRTNAADDAQLQLFKLHGDLPQKVRTKTITFYVVVVVVIAHQLFFSSRIVNVEEVMLDDAGDDTRRARDGVMGSFAAIVPDELLSVRDVDMPCQGCRCFF